MKPEILFEDAHLLVLIKPVGLLSQGDASGELSLVDWLREHFGRHYVGLVHRLDRNTGGLMVIAKRTKSARRLTLALQQGKIERAYIAWLGGTLAEATRWESWVRKDEDRNLLMAAHPTHLDAKRAELQVWPIMNKEWRGRDCTLAAFLLETGRSHQIRFQSSQAGHPVIGDVKYGGSVKETEHMCLYSFWMRFEHPMSGEKMEFYAEPFKDIHRAPVLNFKDIQKAWKEKR